MLLELSSALRAALPNAEIQLLDAAPAPVNRNPHPAPRPVTLITARWLISTNGSESEYEAALRQMLENPVVMVDGEPIAVRLVAVTLAEQVRLWLALGRPFVPSLLVEAGPLAI